MMRRSGRICHCYQTGRNESLDRVACRRSHTHTRTRCAHRDLEPIRELGGTWDNSLRTCRDACRGPGRPAASRVWLLPLRSGGSRPGVARSATTEEAGERAIRGIMGLESRTREWFAVHACDA